MQKMKTDQRFIELGSLLRKYNFDVDETPYLSDTYNSFMIELMRNWFYGNHFEPEIMDFFIHNIDLIT